LIKQRKLKSESRGSILELFFFNSIKCLFQLPSNDSARLTNGKGEKMRRKKVRRTCENAHMTTPKQ